MNFSLTKPTSNFRANIFAIESQRFVAMRAGSIRIGGSHLRARRIKAKIGCTKFTLNSLTQVFAMDFQLFSTAAALDVPSIRYQLHQRIDLLQGEKCRNFHATAFELGIQ